MSADAAEPRTTRTPAEVLLKARLKASQDKRSAVTQALTAMVAAGEMVTFATVAKRARVSTWLVYSPGVRDQVQYAIDQQQQVADAPVRTAPRVDSLRTDLALARQEIHELRRDREELRARLSETLGRQLTNLSTAPLVERLNRVTGELSEARATNATLSTQVEALQEDLIAARTSLRKMIRDQNTEL
jgi:chromosome segregation ATPase